MTDFENQLASDLIRCREENGRLTVRIAELEVRADLLAEALRLTQEYVGDETLPALPGWSWFDALEHYRRYRALA